MMKHFFEPTLQRGRRGILLRLELKKNCSGFEFQQINLCYEGSYSGYVTEPKNLLKQQTPSVKQN